MRLHESWAQEAGQGVRGEALYEGRRTERRVDDIGWHSLHGFTEGSGSRECAARAPTRPCEKERRSPRLGGLSDDA